MIRGLVLAAAVAIAPLAARAQEAVRVGFRADAPPFSFRMSAGGPFRGFLVELCTEALASRGLRIEPVLVTAETRFDLLERGAATGGVDMLCDPTSVQRATLDRFLLSPQVFASAVGYLRHQRGEAVPAGDVVRYGFLQGTTAGVAVELADKADVMTLRAGIAPEQVPIATHQDGVEQVCDGTLDFYFGDIDILKAFKARIGDGAGERCAAVTDSNRQTFSYEAYVLAVNPARADVAMALQSGLFTAFSDGTADRIYASHFGDRQKSMALQAVFALNHVMPCGLLSPDPCAARVPDAVR